MPIIGALPVTLANGTTADATQVMSNFSWILTNVNANAAPLVGTPQLTAANVFTLPQTAAAATAVTHLATLGQVQNQANSWIGTFGGTANVLTATASPAPAAYAAGQTFRGIVATANTGAATVNFNLLGAKNITKNGTTALVVNDLPAGAVITLVYDGTQFQLVNVQPFSHGADIASAATVNLSTRTGRIVNVTGTVTITAITLAEGDFCVVQFTGIARLTNGASLVLPGGQDIFTAAGDFAIFVGYATSVVKCASYTRASGGPVNRTGILEDYIGTTAPAGAVLASGRTMGSTASAATERANDDTINLYTLLWNSMADAEAPVSGGRGANAAADFAANKTITLPDLRGRVVAGKDNMGGSTAGRITASGCGITGTLNGTSGGEETHILTIAESAAHTHIPSVAVVNGIGSILVLQRLGVSDGNAGVTFGLATTSSGLDGAHNNVQPTYILSKIIWL